MKIFSKLEIIPIILLAAMLGLSVWLYYSPLLPDVMPTHWNAQGQIDGWASREFALFFPPVFAIFLYILMLFLPKIDPMKENYSHFKRQYFLVRLALVIFFFGLFLFSISSSLGSKMDIRYFIIPFISAFFLVIGLALKNIKKNYFFGIRTPWTLQSDEVWQKTHLFGSKAFVVGALLSLLSLLAGKYSFHVFLFFVLLGSLAPVVYSYFAYKKLGLLNK